MSKITVMKFFGNTCMPCKVLTPQVEKVKESRPDVEFIDVEVESDPGTAGQYGIMGVPAVVFLKDGVEVERFIGFRPSDQIEEIIDEIKG